MKNQIEKLKVKMVDDFVTSPLFVAVLTDCGERKRIPNFVVGFLNQFSKWNDEKKFEYCLNETCSQLFLDYLISELAAIMHSKRTMKLTRKEVTQTINYSMDSFNSTFEISLVDLEKCEGWKIKFDKMTFNQKVDFISMPEIAPQFALYLIELMVETQSKNNKLVA
jgi:hypothetical protein